MESDFVFCGMMPTKTGSQLTLVWFGWHFNLCATEHLLHHALLYRIGAVQYSIRICDSCPRSFVLFYFALLPYFHSICNVYYCYPIEERIRDEHGRNARSFFGCLFYDSLVKFQHSNLRFMALDDRNFYVKSMSWLNFPLSHLISLCTIAGVSGTNGLACRIFPFIFYSNRTKKKSSSFNSLRITFVLARFMSAIRILTFWVNISHCSSSMNGDNE